MSSADIFKVSADKQTINFRAYFENLITDNVNAKLKDSADSLIANIYETLPENDRKLLKSKITTKLLDSWNPKITICINDNSTNNRTRIEKDPKNRCMARTNTHKQCKRSRQNSSIEYCTGHIEKQKYGRIDEAVIEKKKLKPKASNLIKIATSITGLNLDEYIKTFSVTFEDKSFLMDEYGILYSDDLNFEILGQLKDDSIFWFKMS